MVEINSLISLRTCPLCPVDHQCVPHRFLDFDALVEDVLEGNQIRIQILTKQGKPFTNKSISIINVHFDAIVVRRSAQENEMQRFKKPVTYEKFIFSRTFDPISGAIFVFWDLEATGLGVSYERIIQIAACAYRFVDGEFIKVNTVEPNGIDCEGGEFNRYIKINKKLKPRIVSLTHITDEMLQSRGVLWNEAHKSFCEYLDQIYHAECHDEKLPLILVAHNGTYFDEQLLINEECRALKTKKPKSLIMAWENVTYLVDSCFFSREISKSFKDQQIKSDHGAAGHSLLALYGQTGHKSREDFHSALSDSLVLYHVMSSEPFLTFLKEGELPIRKPEHAMKRYFDHLKET